MARKTARGKGATQCLAPAAPPRQHADNAEETYGKCKGTREADNDIKRCLAHAHKNRLHDEDRRESSADA